MNWFFSKPKLTREQAARLATWKALPAPDLGTPFAASRYVVVDVETTGLNLARDRLIAIGAVAIVGGKIQLADSMEVIVQQPHASDHDNILIHGIGGTAQTEGVAPAEAMLTFIEFLARSPLLAFHVTFDRTMIERALRAALGLTFKHPWADLAYLAPALYPELANHYRALDDWMGQFGISNYARHSALADALSTAELMLALRQQMQIRHVNNFRNLHQLEKAKRMTNWAGC